MLNNHEVTRNNQPANKSAANNHSQAGISMPAVAVQVKEEQVSQPEVERRMPNEAWHVMQQKQANLKTVGISHGGVVQRTIYMWNRKEKVWEEMSKRSKQGNNTLGADAEKGDKPLPKNGDEGIFFNDINGKQGKSYNDVRTRNFLDGTSELFQKLWAEIRADDELPVSKFDANWKAEVLINKNVEVELIRLNDNRRLAIPIEDVSEKPLPTFGHTGIGSFDIGEESTKKRLETQPALLSEVQETREGGVGTVRGSDESYSSYQGAILRQFILEERRAILGLVRIASGADAIFSLERGGSLIADLIEKLSRERIANIKVAKPTAEHVERYDKHASESSPKITTSSPQETSPALPLAASSSGNVEAEAEKEKEAAKKFAEHQKQVHVDLFIRQMHEFIMKKKEEGLKEVTIAITETAVGGGSVNSLLKSIKPLCESLKSHQDLRVKFKILVARETIKNTNYEGSGIVKIHDPIYLQKGNKGGIDTQKQLETLDPSQVEVFISQTRYLIGEDVDYQLQYPGGSGASNPVVVFEERDNIITALSIKPNDPLDSARNILIDLIAGAYDGVMADVFR